MEKEKYELQKILAFLLNNNPSRDAILELRSKLGFPLYINSFQDPKGTMNFLIVLLTNTVHAESYSLVLVSCATLCFRFLPKTLRLQTTIDLEKCLPNHAVPFSIDELQTYINYYENGGASYVPCKEEILKAILGNKDENISLTPKLILPIIKENLDILANILYKERGKNAIGIKDLFLFGEIGSKIKLPRPKDNNLIEKLSNLCLTVFKKRETFYEMEAALLCYSLLISWGVLEPDFDLINLDNISLRSLAINAFAKRIEYKGLIDFPTFPKTDNKIVLTDYLRMIISALKRNDTNIWVLKEKVPHWILDAIVCEFYTTEKPDSIILNSQFPFNFRIEDMNLLCQITDYLPTWIYLHIMRMKHNNPVFVKSCLKIISKAPKFIILNFFNDFLYFLNNIIKLSSPLKDISHMIKKLLPIMDDKIEDLICNLIQNFDIFSEKSNTILTYLYLMSITIRFTNDIKPFICIYDLILEYFEYLLLSPKIIKVVFIFFSQLAKYRPSSHKRLLFLALAVIRSPFIDSPPKYLNTPFLINLFKTSKRFFSLIPSDIITNPIFNFKSIFPPISSALILISSIENIDLQMNQFILEALLDSFTLCPLESCLASKVLDENILDPFIKLVNDLLERYDNSSFTILATHFNKKEIQNIVLFDEKDDLRLILKFQPIFAYILLQYPDKYHILFEKDFLILKNLELEPLKMKHIDLQLRRVFKHLNWPQPPLERNDNWIAMELENENSTFLQNKRNEFLPFYMEFNKNIPKLCSKEEFSNIFRVRFPVPKEDKISMQIYEILHRYRKKEDIKSYFYRFFSFSTQEFLDEFPHKLWLNQFTQPLVINFQPHENILNDVYLIRNHKYQLEQIDENSILFTEKIRVNNNIQDLNTISLSILFGKMSPTLMNRYYLSIPSFDKHILSNMYQFLKTCNTKEFEDEYSKVKETFSSYLSELDIRNPFINEEFGNVVYICNLRKIPITSLVVNSFLSLIFKDPTKFSNASYFNNETLIKRVYHDYTGSKYLIKKFCSICKQNNINILLN